MREHVSAFQHITKAECRPKAPSITFAFTYPRSVCLVPCVHILTFSHLCLPFVFARNAPSAGFEAPKLGQRLLQPPRRAFRFAVASHPMRGASSPPEGLRAVLSRACSAQLIAASDGPLISRQQAGYSSVGRASDCRMLQQSDGPWFDSGWPD